MLRKNAKIELLRHVPLFSCCSKANLAQIAMIADEIDLPAGKVLISEGAPGRQFFVIVSGNVGITQNGRKVPIRAGAEFFGEMALLTDTPTNATVTTTSPVRALVIADRAFRSLIRTCPGIELQLMRALADRAVAAETL